MPGQDRYRSVRGRYRPCCGGRCLLARPRSGDDASGASATMILVPTASFFYLLPRKQSSLLPACLAFLCLALSLASLVAAMVTEPGILPAAPPDEPREETKQARRKITHVVIRGHRIKLQERRAKYTRHTDSVVERFDHHCPWVGNAVGLRNYYYFVSFVFWTTALSLVVGLKSGLRLYTLSKSRHYLDRVEPWQVVGLASLTAYCVVIFLLVGGLFAYHFTLISRNITTNEDLRATYPSRKSNPHDRGCVANWKACLFGKTPPSYVLQLDREELLGDVEMARRDVVEDEFRDAKDVV